MQILDKVVFSKTEPSNTNFLWIKPVSGDGIAIYLFDGYWKNLRLMDDKGTSSIDDDTEVDLNNIPTMDNIEEKIQEEVTTQMADHDENIRDTHNADSADSDEYPEVSII